MLVAHYDGVLNRAEFLIDIACSMRARGHGPDGVEVNLIVVNPFVLRFLAFLLTALYLT